MISYYNPKKTQPRLNPEGDNISVDVFVIDEHGLHGIAFFCYESNEWLFHTDTLIDYNEEGNNTKWLWYYPTPKKDTVKKWFNKTS